jgi:cysteine-S-conjugate beta-lyase
MADSPLPPPTWTGRGNAWVRPGTAAPRPGGESGLDFAERVDATTVEQLRAQGSFKWSRPGPDGYGAFVAEMDFGTAGPVLRALGEVCAGRRFGYLSDELTRELQDACAAWQREHHGWQVAPGDVHVVPNVIRALEITIRHFSTPGSPVILPTPAYMPFLDVPAIHGRAVIQVPMAREQGRYVLDLDAIAAAHRAGGHLLILCNPCNPVGRVFERAELEALSAVVDRHGGRVFADEVHAPLVYPGHRHIPYASVSDLTAGHTVTATSASKAWNLPGLICAQMVLSNDADRATWDALDMFVSYGASTPGVVAGTAAYRHGLPWLTEAVAYLDRNRRLLAGLLATHLPLARHRMPEGTYLAWIDLSAYDLPASPGAWIAEQARVIVVDGPECGTGGAGSIRFNFATPRPVLEEMVRRMADAVDAAPPRR